MTTTTSRPMPTVHAVGILCSVMLWTALCAAGGEAAGGDGALPGVSVKVELGLAFPPVRNHEELKLTAGHLDKLRVRAIRIGESWKWREPEKGRFNWAPLDERMKFFRERGWSVFLTIQSDGPDWAVNDIRNEKSAVYRSDGDFDRYVSALVCRYSNQLDRIQFGNEWEWKEWYAGTADDFIRFNNVLYDAVKRHNPGTTVVLGGLSTPGLRWLAAVKGRRDHVVDAGRSITGKSMEEWRESVVKRGWLDRVERVLSLARYDMLDVHMYDDPEDWSICVETLRALCPGRRILVSEFGGPDPAIERPDADRYQADCLRSYIMALENLGIEEAYFFTLAPHAGVPYYHRNSSLLDESFERKAAYDVFRSFSGSRRQGVRDPIPPASSR